MQDRYAGDVGDFVKLGRAIDACGALSPDVAVHAEKLDPTLGVPGRQAWHERALASLANRDVVLVDPDNGIRSNAGRGKLQKYALLSELADYAARGQSIVAYHHADRSASAQQQARKRLDELAAGVDQDPVGAVIARRGSCRFFLVTADERHHRRLASALASFASRWRRHVELVTDGPLAPA